MKRKYYQTVRDKNGVYLGYYLVADTNVKPKTENKHYILNENFTQKEIYDISKKESEKWMKFRNEVKKNNF